MTMRSAPRRMVVSIGLLARNEEFHLPAMLESLFRQTLFAELDRRGHRAEIWCVANGCTDNTAAIAEKYFHEQMKSHPHREAFIANAVSVPTPGKINAWNLFVHEISTREVHCLILMDADIRLGHTTTLWNLYQGLEKSFAASVTVGEAVKDLELKPTPTLLERISLATSRMTKSDGPQLTGQLYCIRAETARRIRLPRELAACDDGFIKLLVCTDFLTRPEQPERVMAVSGASHIFEAYTSPLAILRNQKRQVIGQTFVHVLIDQYLPSIKEDADGLAEEIRNLDEQDPDWLRRLINDHLQESRHFWRLFPNLATFRLQRWAQQRGWARIRNLPATLVGTAVTLFAAWEAHRFLSQGATSYWPDKSGRSRPRLPARFDLARRAVS